MEKIGLSEGWISKNAPVIEFESSKKETISEDEINAVEITEVKMLAEEVKRMKELVDFRSPLMNKDGQ